MEIVKYLPYLLFPSHSSLLFSLPLLSCSPLPFLLSSLLFSTLLLPPPFSPIHSFSLFSQSRASYSLSSHLLVFLSSSSLRCLLLSSLLSFPNFFSTPSLKLFNFTVAGKVFSYSKQTTKNVLARIISLKDSYTFIVSFTEAMKRAKLFY